MSAKATFGTLKHNLYQGDYINAKKNYSLYCKKKCKKYKFYYNTYNLIMGQYTKSDLKDVCVISLGNPPTAYCSDDTPCDPCQTTDQVPINTTSSIPFYFNQTVDPLGQLFGSTQCDQLNYIRYMVPN